MIYPIMRFSIYIKTMKAIVVKYIIKTIVVKIVVKYIIKLKATLQRSRHL